MRSTPLQVIILVCLGALAGCIQAEGPDQGNASWTFGGAFEESADQEDFDDFQRRMGQWGAEVLLMESFPVQFAVRGLNADDCPVAHEEASGLLYLRSVGDCRAQTVGTSPDEPTSDAS